MKLVGVLFSKPTRCEPRRTLSIRRVIGCLTTFHSNGDGCSMGSMRSQVIESIAIAELRGRVREHPQKSETTSEGSSLAGQRKSNADG